MLPPHVLACEAACRTMSLRREGAWGKGEEGVAVVPYEVSVVQSGETWGNSLSLPQIQGALTVSLALLGKQITLTAAHMCVSFSGVALCGLLQRETKGNHAYDRLSNFPTPRHMGTLTSASAWDSQSMVDTEITHPDKCGGS